MLIFDGFPTRADAERFAQEVKETAHKDATVCDTQDESDQIDLFPFVLNPPIVLTGRGSEQEEGAIIALVGKHNGSFAGT